MYETPFLSKETKIAIGTIMLAAMGIFAYMHLDISGYLAGETDIFGNYLSEKRAEARWEALSPVGKVHAEWFPSWLIQKSKPEDPRRTDRIDELETKIREALEDQQLKDVFNQFVELYDSGQLRDAQKTVRKLTNEWNARLEKLNKPYFMRLRVFYRGGKHLIFGGFYKQVGDATYGSGKLEAPVRIMQRIDNTNFWEAYAGLTGAKNEYAFVIADRLVEVAAKHIAPLIAEKSTRKLSPVDETFKIPMRDFLQQKMGTETYKNLQSFATAREALLGYVEDIRQRRSCGSQFRITNPRWDGYRAKTFDTLSAYADRDRLKPCPTVKPKEARKIRELSHELREDRHVEAFRRLLSVMSRPVAVQQAKLFFNNKRYADGGNPDCPGCELDLHERTRVHLSANLSSLAWGSGAMLGLYRLCKSRIGEGPGAAKRFMFDKLNISCRQVPPGDLAEQAQKLEAKLFGEKRQIKLKSDYPRVLDLSIL